MKVSCPNCKAEVEYSTDNKFRPFCSERCRLIDLGQWAEESYSVPVDPHAYDDQMIEDVQKIYSEKLESTGNSESEH